MIRAMPERKRFFSTDVFPYDGELSDIKIMSKVEKLHNVGYLASKSFQKLKVFLQGAVGPGMRSGVVASQENLEGATR